MTELDPLTYLQPDQLVSEGARPVPRARLTRRMAVGLWVLRVVVLVLSTMVVYTFIAQLGS